MGLPTQTEWRGDCDRCVGLCCVAPAFARSTDFAIDKPAGAPCPHLRSDFRCGIHDQLRARGMGGCVVFDCFGAGQRVTAWGDHPRRDELFHVARALHELCWLLERARGLAAAAPLQEELADAADATERLLDSTAEGVLAVDVAAHRGRVNPLLVRASALARSGLEGRELRGVDLIGADLRGADLRGASLRGAFLIGADLRDADLSLADLTGADLRGADLRGADLADTLFLSPSQLESARGDATTRLPAGARVSWRPDRG